MKENEAEFNENAILANEDMLRFLELKTDSQRKGCSTKNSDYRDLEAIEDQFRDLSRNLVEILETNDTFDEIESQHIQLVTYQKMFLIKRYPKILESWIKKCPYIKLSNRGFKYT